MRSSTHWAGSFLQNTSPHNGHTALLLSSLDASLNSYADSMGYSCRGLRRDPYCLPRTFCCYSRRSVAMSKGHVYWPPIPGVRCLGPDHPSLPNLALIPTRSKSRFTLSLCSHSRTMGAGSVGATLNEGFQSAALSPVALKRLNSSSVVCGPRICRTCSCN